MAINVIMPSGCLGERISHILIYQGRSHCLDLVLKQSSPASHEDSGSYIIILHIFYKFKTGKCVAALDVSPGGRDIHRSYF